MSTTLPPRVAEPGMSDEAIKKGSGKSWDEWFALLDAWGALEMTHTEIARYISADTIAMIIGEDASLMNGNLNTGFLAVKIAEVCEGKREA